MNVIRNTLFILPLLLLSPLIVAAAPYDTLKFALRQQQITDDLRQTFINDKQNQKQNQVTLTAAAQALKNQDDPAYRERMAQVVCPPQTN